MNQGELYIADCPFKDRPGSKRRPVVIMHVLDDGVAVIESRSRYSKSLDLALAINFDNNPAYSHVKLSGTSHFYSENFVVIPREAIQTPRLGALRDVDFKRIAEHIGFPPLG